MSDDDYNTCVLTADRPPQSHACGSSVPRGQQVPSAQKGTRRQLPNEGHKGWSATTTEQCFTVCLRDSPAI